MSTDYYLFSSSHRRAAMVGSNGLSGVQSFPADPDVIKFIRWAIEEGIGDVCLMSEYEMDALAIWCEDCFDYNCQGQCPKETANEHD